MKNFWINISQIGVQPHMSSKQTTTTELTNTACLVIIITLFISSVVALFFKTYGLILFNGSLILLSVVPILLNYWQLNDYAKHLSAAIAMLIAGLGAFLFGADTYGEFYIPLIVIYYLTISHERHHTWFFCVLALLFLLLFKVVYQNFEPILAVDIDVYSREVSVLCLTLSGFYLVDFFKTRIISQAKKIKLQNEVLQTEILRREMVEKELKLSQQRLKLATDMGNIGVWDADITKNEIYYSDACAKLLGHQKIEREESIDTFYEVFHPEDKVQTKKAIIQGLSENHFFDREFRVIVKNGVVKWFRDIGKVIDFDKNGQPKRALGVVWDITRNKQLEERLKQDLYFFQSLIDKFPNPIFYLNRAGIIVQANHAFLDFFGLTKESIKHKTSKDLLPQLALNCLKNKDSESIPVTLELKNATGEKRIFQLNTKAFTFNGTNGIIGNMHDVTAKARVKAQIMNLNKELSQFTSVASHDMKEPLRTISSFSDLLIRRNSKQLDKDGQMFLQFINDAAKRMTTLLEDLLKYTKVGKSNLELQETDLDKVMVHVKNNLNAKISETNALLHIDPLPTILAELTGMTQVLQNLIANALKFQAPNSIPNVQVSATKSITHHTIMIKDNGIGIREEDQVKIFEVFKRLHNKEQYEGSGLGLATCKKIMERYSGTISISSSLGNGTTFFLTFPLVENSKAEQPNRP